METFCPFLPSPCLCSHDLCDAVGDVGHHSLCSTCCTSLRTLSPTVDTFLFPSDRGLRDWDPSGHKGAAPEEVAFVHLGCGSGSLQGSETVTETYRVLLLPLPPRLLHGKGEGTVVSQSDDTRKTLIESGTLSVSVHNCVHSV